MIIPELAIPVPPEFDTVMVPKLAMVPVVIMPVPPEFDTVMIPMFLMVAGV